MPKKIVICLLLIICTSYDVRAAEPTPEAIFREANGLFRGAVEMSLKDPDKAQQLYQQAALQFDYLITQHNVNTAALHYNLANAYHFAGDNGRALLHYHRARRIKPYDVDVNHNLEYVRSLSTDDVPPTRLAQILAIAAFWHKWPFAVRATLFALPFIGIWVILGMMLYQHRRRELWVVLGACALTVLVFGPSSAITALRMCDPIDGVIIAQEVTARQGNGHIYDNAFTTDLHSGTEFGICEERGDWYHIELLNGERCWIPHNSAALID